MSNEFVAPYLMNVADTPQLQHIAAAPKAPPLSEALPQQTDPYQPTVFKGRGHEEIEKAIVKVLSKLPYQELDTPKHPKIKMGLAPVLKALFSTQISAGGAAFTAGLNTLGCMINVTGIEQTMQQAQILQEKGLGVIAEGKRKHRKEPDPVALRGHTRMLRTGQTNLKLRNDTGVIPTPDTENSLVARLRGRSKDQLSR